MVRNFVSVKTIIEKLYRDNGTNDELPVDNIIEWCSEALLFIGAFSQFETKIAELTIANNKTELPCGFINLIDISHDSLPLYYAGKSLINNLFCSDCKISTFDSSVSFGVNKQYFYYQGNNLVTSFSIGTVCISYTSMVLDEDGFPMIPDDVSYSKACASYVTMMLDRQDWRRGRTTDKVYAESKQDWDWYCGQAKGSANMPSLAQLENLKNVIVRLIPAQNQYSRMFQQDREQKRIQ